MIKVMDAEKLIQEAKEVMQITENEHLHPSSMSPVQKLDVDNSSSNIDNPPTPEMLSTVQLQDAEVDGSGGTMDPYWRKLLLGKQESCDPMLNDNWVTAKLEKLLGLPVKGDPFAVIMEVERLLLELKRNESNDKK